MPFHGETEWNEELLFTAEDLLKIFQLHSHIMSKPITLLGYSMGGRVALNFFQQYPSLIKEIILVAPDGLSRNIWHRLATQTHIGNYLFKFTMRYPKWLLKMVNIFDKQHILNKNIMRFVRQYLNSATNRAILYKRWVTLQKCSPNLYLIKKLIAERFVSIKMLFGKNDPFIQYKIGEKFQRGCETFVDMKVIEADHQLLREKYISELIQLLNH